MDVYDYKGIKGGKYTYGEIEAINKDEAAYKLRGQKVIITGLEKSKTKSTKTLPEKKINTKTTGKVPPKEILIMTKSLATMVKAGLPVLDSIGMAKEQAKHKKLIPITNEIYKDVESGQPLSEAFGKYEKNFDSVYINMLKAGEASGKLDIFLNKLVLVLEKREKIKSSIKGALFYPAILFTISISVMVLMLIKVVPIFASMYENMGVELPGATKTILSVSAFIKGPGGLFTLISIVLIALTHKFLMKKNYNYRKFFHRFFLKMPLFGNLILKSILARKALIMGNLASAGVNLLENIDIATTVTDNVIIQEAMENIKRGVFSGTELSKLYQSEKIFPLTFSQLIKVGEKTGNIEEIYTSIATYYEEEFDNAVEALSKTIEPIMIVFMGVIIGLLLLALYSPIFNIGAIIG